MTAETETVGGTDAEAVWRKAHSPFRSKMVIGGYYYYYDWQMESC